jgi:hypothetical protein
MVRRSKRYGMHFVEEVIAALLALPVSVAASSAVATEVTVVEAGCYGRASIWQGGQMVRRAPDVRSAVIDQLAEGASVTVCERSGLWRGIVYSLDRPLDCGLNDGAGEAYSGYCRSGWVPVWALTVTAG